MRTSIRDPCPFGGPAKHPRFARRVVPGTRRRMTETPEQPTQPSEVPTTPPPVEVPVPPPEHPPADDDPGDPPVPAPD